MLARAVAGMTDMTFFNISASSLASKWRGESEKMVRILFEMARQYSPSILFFDEIDALFLTRGTAQEHEASRRVKSEMFSQLDGIISNDSSASVMILATTNVPWDLDEALRRRLEKRIYIPLPGFTARREMFMKNMASVSVDPDVSFDELAERTENYSGADIYLLCRDASMVQMRNLVADRTPEEIRVMQQHGHFSFSLKMSDFLAALERIRPSVNLNDIQRYEIWSKEFGSI
eukprot:TRINITY_DN5596_c0_g1_i1.p1 TRINITY_DN5596_c0_g1~~TRINITY_DN5596_c0_g1_i1.p1  ORF type:complete len:233 (-),score=41.22 TRINITY_DN5596_c0_g1_i1:67-765(-)